MRILADENIPLLEHFFAGFGDLRRLPGRTLSAADVRDADVLLVRSVTQVNEALLAGSRVRFVGTATIGTDHVDLDYLQRAGIAFASAPGCNAGSVVEYLLSCLTLFAERRQVSDWRQLSVGIVGAGNVGGRLWRCLTQLGFCVKVTDPPLATRLQSTADQLPECMPEYTSLEQVLACDIITLHTPLTRDGSCPTWHLLDERQLARLGGHQLLVNTSRGAVIDCAALKARLALPDAPTVVLDVWEGEPQVDADLAHGIWLMTPHIAGYSLEGKVRGTEMIYQALCRHLAVKREKTLQECLPDAPLQRLAFSQVATSEALFTAIRVCYDPRDDDAALRQLLQANPADAALGFDRLRRTYRQRRAFSSLELQFAASSGALARQAGVLGFRVASGN